MDLYNCLCSACGAYINQDETGEPYLPFKNIILCSTCYINLVPEIYRMAGKGDGGLIHLQFKYFLQSTHNIRKRTQIRQYQTIFKQLLHKYNFACVLCGEVEQKKLAIDHIHPVARGGTDDFNNLQILCKSCNSRKGAKVALV